MPHEIASVLTCKLCTHKIAGPAGLVIGPGQSSRVGQFMESLTAHLAQAHPKQFEVLQQKALEFFGLNCIMQYVTQDDRVRYQRDWLRWQIHQVTLNARYTDEKLGLMAAHFAGEMVDETIEALMHAMQAADSGNLRNVFGRAGVNIKAGVGAKLVEIVTTIRNELQEPTEPQPPASVSVVKVG